MRNNLTSNVVTALVEVGHYLESQKYSFVAITPETHRRVDARNQRPAESLRDIFGWSRVFLPRLVPTGIVQCLLAAGALEENENGFRSKVRFASLRDKLFVHSSFPTNEANSVFFGPDTYRFLTALKRSSLTPGTLVDVGCGTGVGGILSSNSSRRVVLADINDQALAFAHVNAALAGRTDVEIVKSDVLAAVDGAIDNVICNPPYLIDPAKRTYRDGGGAFGEGLALRVVSESLDRLSRGGTLVLYTGTAIVEGGDTFWKSISPLLSKVRGEIRYEEIDPDVFGEELDQPGYAKVERIAAVLLTVRL